ncbi:MAG TPA: NAD-binding protein, partial [Thermodesulfobacteriota bacterium]|nr:NAD-binding protein [Thermodesulfobacteriota bacterium]
GVDLIRKDLGLSIESARVNKVPLYMTAQANQYFTRATAEGSGKKDMSCMIELLEKTAGVQVRGKVQK